MALCGWEGNRRSGIALMVHHKLSGLSTYRLNGHRKGEKHTTYTPVRVWHLHLYIHIAICSCPRHCTTLTLTLTFSTKNIIDTLIFLLYATFTQFGCLCLFLFWSETQTFGINRQTEVRKPIKWPFSSHNELASASAMHCSACINTDISRACNLSAVWPTKMSVVSDAVCNFQRLHCMHETRINLISDHRQCIAIWCAHNSVSKTNKKTTTTELNAYALRCSMRHIKWNACFIIISHNHCNKQD